MVLESFSRIFLCKKVLSLHSPNTFKLLTKNMLNTKFNSKLKETPQVTLLKQECLMPKLAYKILFFSMLLAFSCSQS